MCQSDEDFEDIVDDWTDEDEFDDVDTEDDPGDMDESMDGDFDTGMASAGFGTDEDYNHYDYGDE